MEDERRISSVEYAAGPTPFRITSLLMKGDSPQWGTATAKLAAVSHTIGNDYWRSSRHQLN